MKNTGLLKYEKVDCQQERFSGNTLRFYLDQYDPFIDFIKGICIILVIITHSCTEHMRFVSLFCVWGDIAVPMFLLLQVFHAYKHGFNKCKFSVKKIWNRIFKWYLLIEAITIGRLLIINYRHGIPNDALFTQIHDSLGIGMGNYYPYIYIEFAIILYLIRNIVKKVPPAQLLVIFIIASELMEMACSLFGIPEKDYRLLFFRYTFLIYLGIIITTKGVEMNKRNLTLSLLSIGLVLLLNYTSIDAEPFIFKTGWKTAHWICYFYIANIMIYIFYKAYNSLQHSIGTKSIRLIGKYSWEIFLLQMFWFTLPIRGKLNVFGNYANITYVVISVMACTVSVMLFKYLLGLVRICKA